MGGSRDVNFTGMNPLHKSIQNKDDKPVKEDGLFKSKKTKNVDFNGLMSQESNKARNYTQKRENHSTRDAVNINERAVIRQSIPQAPPPPPLPPSQTDSQIVDVQEIPRPPPPPPPPPPIPKVPSELALQKNRLPSDVKDVSVKKVPLPKGRLKPTESVVAQMLQDIRNGHKNLNKVREDKKNHRDEVKRDTKQTENDRTPDSYVFEGYWLAWKKQLTDLICKAEGKHGDNNYLNYLMLQHAEYAKKTGTSVTMLSDLDEKGNKRKERYKVINNYESYVRGRKRETGDPSRKAIDRNNNFNANIESFLDNYLNDLKEKCQKTKKDLAVVMKERFNIESTVASPKEFFAEHTNLAKQLAKTKFQQRWLEGSDITPDFVYGLLEYDRNSNIIAKHLDRILARQMERLQQEQKELELAYKVHTDNMSRS